jgi:hypothetical protein
LNIRSTRAILGCDAQSRRKGHLERRLVFGTRPLAPIAAPSPVDQVRYAHIHPHISRVSAATAPGLSHDHGSLVVKCGINDP